MTPREFWRFIAGLRKKSRYEEIRAVQAAWFNAMWQRAEKMPRLDKVMRDLFPDGSKKAAPPPKPMTPAESRAKMRLAFAAHGVIEQP